jgi:class 3 adenylate cyclase
MFESESDGPFDAATAFIDIRRSTVLTASLGAWQTKELLESFFAEVLARVVDEGGYIGDINGDGVLAIFRGSGRVDRAFNAAVAVELMVADQARFGSVPGIRIGVHDGQVCPGYVGHGPARQTFWVGANVAAKVSRMLSGSQNIGMTDRAHAALSPQLRDGARWSGEEHVTVDEWKLVVRTLPGDRTLPGAP